MMHPQPNKNESILGLLGYCFLILICSSVVRLWLSGSIEDGGDAFLKWGIIRRYVEFGVLPSLEELRSHHMMRWSITIPVFCIQKFLGTDPVVYYVWPILISTIGAVFVFFITRNCFTAKLGLIAAFAFILSKPFLRQGSQFLPMGPATVYMLGSILFLQSWFYLNRKRLLFLAGIFWFLSWGAKITSIYYLPAFFILIFFQSNADKKGRVWPLFFSFALLIILLLALEAYLTSFPTQMNGGRVAALFGNSDIMYDAAPRMHTDQDGWRRGTDSLMTYLANFFIYFKAAAASYRTIFLYYMAFGVSIWAIWVKHPKLLPLSTFYILGFLGHAYAIIGVFPFLRPERINVRYLTLVYILAILVLLFHFFGLLKKYRSHGILNGQSLGSKLKSIIGGRGAKGLILGYGLLVFCLIPPMAQLMNQLKTNENGIVSTYQNTLLITHAISKGQDIWVRLDNHSESKKKKLIKFFMVYEDSRRLRNIVAALNDMNVDPFKTMTVNKRPYVIINTRNRQVKRHPEREPILVDI